MCTILINHSSYISTTLDYDSSGGGALKTDFRECYYHSRILDLNNLQS